MFASRNTFHASRLPDWQSARYSQRVSSAGQYACSNDQYNSNE